MTVARAKWPEGDLGTSGERRTVTASHGSKQRQPKERLFRRISEVLRHASVPRPMWHLSPRERWHLLRDTLLGHAPIRGGLRPRDLPFDTYCRAAISTAARVHSLPSYTVRAAGPGSITFIEWLVVYSALVETRSTDDPAAAERFARDAVYDCIDELRRALRFDTPDVPIAECPFVHRMLGLLGLSQQEWERSDGRPGTTGFWRNRDDARLAVIMGRSSRPEAAQPRLSREEQEALGRIREGRFRLLTVRTRDVQGYLERGTRHWLMRGASAWCSQALSLVRDLLMEADGHAPGDVILLSDSDAIFSVLVPSTLTVEGVASRLERKLRDFWGGRSSGIPASDARFPRLAEYRAMAIAAGVDPAGVMPAIKIVGSRPLSAVDLCTGSFSRFKAPEESSVLFRGAAPTSAPCQVVSGDVRITDRSPPWLRDQGARSATAMGWTGVVWSLCGTTFRTHCHEGLAARIGSPHLRIIPVNQGDWLNAVALSEEPLAYVKIDGDTIGRRFRKTRIPRLPGLGLALADTVFRRLMAVAQAVFDQAGPGGTSTYLPFDTVYLGGDDLLCCIPQSVLPAVLDAFGRPLSGDRHWPNIAFTFAAIELPAKGELVQEGDRTPLTAMAAAATRGVGPALAYAKSLTKGEEDQLVANERILRGTLENAGATVDVIGDLETHGCVRGVRIRIRPRSARAGDVHGG